MPGHQVAGGELPGALQRQRGRREGRRSLSAYRAHARGASSLAGTDATRARSRTRGAPRECFDESFNAASALALIYPLLRSRGFVCWFGAPAPNLLPGGPHRERGEGACMKRKPSIESLATVSL